jgi:hypothetical protein
LGIRLGLGINYKVRGRREGIRLGLDINYKVRVRR